MQNSKLNNTIKCIVLIIFIILTQWVYGMAVNHMVEDCEIVKGLVYNFPIARIMDFLLGALLGKVVVLSDKIDYRWNIIYDIVAIWLIIVTQLVVELLEAKYWWTYAAFLSPGVLLFIWCVINEKSFISKICSCNVLIKIGEDSAYLYLIHELVIRYSRIVLRKVVDVNQLDIKIGIAVVSLMITFCLVILWKKIYVNCDWKKMYLRHQ